MHHPSLFFKPKMSALAKMITPSLMCCLRNFYLTQANVTVTCGCGAALTTPPQYVILIDDVARGFACKCLHQYDNQTRTLATTQGIVDWLCLPEEAYETTTDVNDLLTDELKGFVDRSLLMDTMLKQENVGVVGHRLLRTGILVKTHGNVIARCDNIEKIHPQYLIVIGDPAREIGCVWIHQFSKWDPAVAATLASWFASDEEIRKKIPEITFLCSEMVSAPTRARMFVSDKSYDESYPQEIANGTILVHVDIFDCRTSNGVPEFVRHYDFSETVDQDSNPSSSSSSSSSNNA